MTILTPPTPEPESQVIGPDFHSPLEQWAIEAAKSIEVRPGPIEGTEAVLLVNDHAGLADREEATIARCRAGDGGLVAQAMWALVERVRVRSEAGGLPLGGVLAPQAIEDILAVRHDPRALIQTIEAAIADRDEHLRISDGEADVEEDDDPDTMTLAAGDIGDAAE